MAKAGKLKQVALAIRVGVPHLESVIRGILQYARAHANWRLTMSADYWPSASALDLRRWSGDGIIAWLNTQAEAQVIAELGIPAVNCSGGMDEAGVPRVTADNRAIGRLAADHLLECGFRRFAYYGLHDRWNSGQRCEGFVEAVEAVGGACSIFNTRPPSTKHRMWNEDLGKLNRWLESLTPPVGLLAYQDYRARRILEACQRLGLNVPDDVAVVGVNNDPVACDYSDPPLTSVSCGGVKVGNEAAALLDRLMAGKRPPGKNVLIPPDGVFKRKSTDIVAIENREVAAAVKFIREHLEEPIGVDDIARHLDISRRWLERAFRDCTGQTPHEYISHARVQRAKQLLTAEEKITMSQIAQMSGFSDARRLRMVFHRITGTSPRRYRHRHADDKR